MPAADFVNGQAARAVIGRYSFDRGDTGVNVQLSGGVSGLAYAAGYLFVADSNRVAAETDPVNGVLQDNRVLMYYTSEIPSPTTDISSLPIHDTVCPICGFAAQNVLGQTNYSNIDSGLSASQLYTPTAVATDGKILAVADTDNNRVLIWTSIPTTPGAPANLVLGQTDFSTRPNTTTVNAQTLRGPQGVWIQGSRLYVADTQNYRVLVWNSIPTVNDQAADLVLGQANFTSAVAAPPASTYPPAAANMLLNPVSVTSDGVHLFVSDLGFNRVLIWNEPPTTMDQPADVVVGQPDMVSSQPNNNSVLCTSNGTSSTGTATYPSRCANTISYPRYALSDGQRLFIADGGNDRILIYNNIPTTNGAAADFVLGQPDFISDVVTYGTISIISTAIDNTSSVNTIPDPQSLAWDGTNLYVSDPNNRRVLVFTPEANHLQNQSVVNWASEIIRQEGTVAIGITSGGAITAGDTVTVTVAGTGYTYTVKSTDTVDTVAQELVSLINASDPNVTAVFAGTGSGGLYLSSKAVNLDADTISLAATASNTVNLTVIASGSYLTAGTAATVAPGTLVEIDGSNLSDATTPVSANANGLLNLPITLAGAQVYVDGFSAHLLRVSATQIIAQVPWETFDRNSSSVYVRTVHGDGSVTVTNATPLTIAPANPGIFDAQSYAGQTRPWPVAGALHQAGNPQAVVSIDGSIKAGDIANIVIAGTTYSYTVLSTDTLASVVSGLISAINSANGGKGDSNVTPSAGGAFTRVVLTAKQPGSAGTGIAISGTTSASADVTVTAYSSTTCCAVSVPGSAISSQNPALPGEVITLLATGIGSVQNLAGTAIPSPVDGAPYPNNNTYQPNTAFSFVSSTVGGSTGQIVNASYPPGSYGVAQIQVLVPTTLSPGANTQITIAQNAFVSNTATIPIGNGAEVLPGGYIPDAGPAQGYPSPAFANFGNLANNSVARLITFNNVGGAPLSFSSIAISGTNASEFTIDQSATTCSAASAMASAASCTVSVVFTRGGAGTRVASLVFTDNSFLSGDQAANPANYVSQSVSLQAFDVQQFEITNKLSGKALDVIGASTQNGARIQQYDFLNGANQQWRLVPVDSQYYQIVNVNSGKVLDDSGFSTTLGTLIQQYDNLGGDNQKWQLVPEAGGYYAIKNKFSGLVLDDSNYSLQSGTLIQLWSYLGGDNQQWIVAPAAYAKIVNKLSGKVLDSPASSLTNGTLIQQWSDNGGPQQRWSITAVGSGPYQVIRNLNSGKVLDVVGSATGDGAQIEQNDLTGADNQEWIFAPAPNGYYVIYNKVSGKVLDDSGFSLLNGTLMQQWNYVGGDNQLWQVVTEPPGS